MRDGAILSGVRAWCFSPVGGAASFFSIEELANPSGRAWWPNAGGAYLVSGLEMLWAGFPRGVPLGDRNAGCARGLSPAWGREAPGSILGVDVLWARSEGGRKNA